MTFKDKLIIYLYRKLSQTEDDYNQSLQTLRYHKADEVDFLETLIRKTRKDTINEVSADIMAIVGMQDREQFDYLLKK